MMLKVLFDFSTYKRGRLVLAYVRQSEGKEPEMVDKEMILKHPLLLRLRMRLAVSRMRRRQRKIEKFLQRYQAGKV